LQIVRVLKKIGYSLVALLVVGSITVYFGLYLNLYVGTSESPEEIYIYGGMLFDAVDGETTFFELADPSQVLEFRTEQEKVQAFLHIEGFTVPAERIE
jgi:hypothetical protein